MSEWCHARQSISYLSGDHNRSRVGRGPSRSTNTERRCSTGRVSGIVLYENGNPVNDATVVAFPTDRGLAAKVPSATTDESGRFVISQLWLGTFQVGAKKESEGYADQTQGFYNQQKIAPTVLSADTRKVSIDRKQHCALHRKLDQVDIHVRIPEVKLETGAEICVLRTASNLFYCVWPQRIHAAETDQAVWVFRNLGTGPIVLGNKRVRIHQGRAVYWDSRSYMQRRIRRLAEFQPRRVARQGDRHRCPSVLARICHLILDCISVGGNQ